MSYCRYLENESDVYVIGTKDHLECFGGGVDQELGHGVHMIEFDERYVVAFETKSRSSMIAHLVEHRYAGHLVPEYAMSRLLKEMNDYGDEYHVDDGFGKPPAADDKDEAI